MDRVRRLLGLGGWSVLLGVLLATGACNTAAKINAPKIYFFNAQILGAVPVVRVGDAFERVCRTSDLQAGQKVEGLSVDLQLISTERKEQNETVFDNDKSIQAGDYINRHYVEAGDLNPDNVRVQVNCLKRTSDTLQRECDPSADVSQPPSEVVGVEHVPYALRSEAWGGGSGAGNGVVVLLDQSGSVSGFVQPDPALGHYEMPYDEANLAITEWQQEHSDPGVLEKLASDKKHYRQAALGALVADLNQNDKLLVMTYNEDYKNRLVCRGAELEDPTMADCFTTRRDWVTRGLDDIPGNEGGRTPLWEAVYNAYEFLQGQTGLAAKHLIIVGDGPDTCHPNSEAFRGGSTACADRDFADVLSLVENGANDVHVHFVQYQALGYKARDVRQAEVACLTDGTYTFVNRTDMGNVEFENALLKAIDRARFSFLGKWRLTVEMDAISLDLPWPQGTPLGNTFQAFGNLKLLANQTFIPTESIFRFEVGNPSSKQGIQETPNWDNSLAFRKDCASNATCGGSDANACKATCGWESHLCLPELNAPVGTACDLGGVGGYCCNGTCQDVNATCP